jgi:hypothetical protein
MKIFRAIIWGITFLFFSTSNFSQELIIKKIELGHPVPEIPFYHFKADLELPVESIIEVEASVNGKKLRATDLYRSDQLNEVDRPPLTHRPPSGYGLSLNGTKYKNPVLVGWVKWETGSEYTIEISVRMKDSVKVSEMDNIISASKKVLAPNNVKLFNSEWKNYKSIVLSETAGIDRGNEVTEVLLSFYPDEAQHLKREIRVVSIDPKTSEWKEIPSQVYDIMKNDKEDDLAPDEEGNPTREVPIWYPTVTARVAFLADVSARSSRVYLIYYNNEDAMAVTYKTDLRVQGEAPGLHFENNKFSAVLHPNSGHLDQITLHNKSKFPLFHRMETNGAIHWNPGVYAPPKAWTHTADWKPPKNISTVSGPIISFSEVWDHLRGVSEVDAAVRYEFYPGVPYFISSTTMRINETVQTIALRNAEIVFKRELMTHVAWYDIIRDKIITYDVVNMPDLTDVKMEADIPWIVFYNEKSGVAFAGIQLEYSNSGLENRPRLLNPYFYVTGGPWIYWSRALSLSFLSSNMQHTIPAMKGNVFSEKWAYLTYSFSQSESPYSAVLDWQKRLTNPLRIHLVEEVDDRVSKTVEEIYMDEGKSGWEERETGKH